MIRRGVRVASPSRANAESSREKDIRWVTELLERVDLTPPADFAAQMRAARDEAEAEDLVSDQVQRAIRAARAENNEGGSRDG